MDQDSRGWNTNGTTNVRTVLQVRDGGRRNVLTFRTVISHRPRATIYAGAMQRMMRALGFMIPMNLEWRYPVVRAALPATRAS
jgi:hypothetical protein